MTDREMAHEALVGGLNVIDRDGWTDGNDGMRLSGPACAYGAIGRHAGTWLRGAGRVSYTLTSRHPAAEALARAAGSAVSVRTVTAWNDYVGGPAVKAAFRRAIQATAPEPSDPLAGRVELVPELVAA